MNDVLVQHKNALRPCLGLAVVLQLVSGKVVVCKWNGRCLTLRWNIFIFVLQSTSIVVGIIFTCLRPQRHQTMWEAREKTATSLMIFDSCANFPSVYKPYLFNWTKWYDLKRTNPLGCRGSPEYRGELQEVLGSGCSPAEAAAVLYTSERTSWKYGVGELFIYCARTLSCNIDILIFLDIGGNCHYTTYLTQRSCSFWLGYWSVRR